MEKKKEKENVIMFRKIQNDFIGLFKGKPFKIVDKGDFLEFTSENEKKNMKIEEFADFLRQFEVFYSK